jgi:hypothetical protein
VACLRPRTWEGQPLLYAVTPVDAVVPSGLRTLVGNMVGVVHAEHETDARSQRDTVLAFSRAVRQIAGTGPALPFRYGTTVADLAELRLVIAENEEAWSTRLAAVSGCCELIVHLHPAAHVVPCRAAARDEVLATLRPWLRESRSLPGARSDRMAVLVPRAAAGRARSRLKRWASARNDLELAVTGPWPPFSFCEASV